MFELPIFFPVFTGLFSAGFFLPIILATLKRRWVGTLSLLLALLGSLYGMGLMGAIWLVGTAVSKSLTWEVAWLSNLLLMEKPLLLGIRIDALSAFFGFLITAFAAIVAVYSFRALDAPHYQAYRNQIASAFNLFVLSTMLVVIVNDVFSLLVSLEVMTLAFAYLVLYKHNLYRDGQTDHPVSDAKKKDARLGPQIYLIISHTSTAFLFIAVLLLAIQAKGVGFDALRDNAQKLTSTLASGVFLLTLAGLGIRAGLTPGHIWVSLVHPSSPTTTHAFSLGIAIKVAVYLMYRFFFEFLEPVAWWGYVVVLVAVITALVNVWYAISSHDLKTALAYHSIENIGIITAGLGLALIFAPDKSDLGRWIMALALLASLYHLLNHAVFKGLLYLATGAIDNLTHQTVEFHKLGGLIKLYPFTSAMFLVGSVSIAGFPPFNGFISEWLTLQALLRGAGAVQSGTGLLVIVVSLVMLVASFALTAFCFYKIAGLTLLGQQRSSKTARINWARRDVPATMWGGMALMAALCLGLGLFPGKILPLLSPVVGALGVEEAVVVLPGVDFLLNAPDALVSDGLPSLALVGSAVVGLLLLGVGAVIAFNPRRTLRKPAIPWNCGTPLALETMQPTSAGLSELLRRLLNAVPEKMKTLAPDYLPARLALSKSTALPQEVVEFFRASDNWLIHFLLTHSEQLGRVVQNRDIRRYLAYILIANVVVLILFLFLGA